MQADGRQADPAADHGGLTRLGGERPEDRVGQPDELLAAHVRPPPDHQPRSEAVPGAAPFDEPELAERPQVAVDRRARGVEQAAQLVGPDLAAIGDGQEDPQAAREGRVLRRFLGWSIPCGGHGRMRSPVWRRTGRCPEARPWRGGLRESPGSASDYWSRPWSVSHCLAASPTSSLSTPTLTPSFVSSSVVILAETASRIAANAVASTFAR